MARTVARRASTKKSWVVPQLHRLVAGKAEDNAGTGGDLNGRLS